jgi:hypothetical protein
VASTTTVVAASVPPSTASTVPVPGTAGRTVPATTSPASSPEGYAKALFAAWTRGDRAAAARVAQPAAVAALFARPWHADDGWSFADCSGAAGSVICMWQRPAGQLLFRVQNVTGGVPVSVAEVRFQP